MLVATFALGLLLRCLDYTVVFPTDGSVLLGVDDAHFHARRALFSFVNFPAVLHFDPFLAYPDGAPAPAPPLFDWATAAVARLIGGDERTLETVAAWVSPVAGAALVWPAYAIGRAVASRGVGLGAAALTAILPSGVLYTRLGNFDHHAVVAAIAACWLALALSCVGRTGRALAVRCAVLSTLMLLMLFTWSGSLLYVALGVGSALGAILLLHGRPGALLALAGSAAGAALPTALWLVCTPTPLGGPMTAQTLSWLHVLGLLGLAGVALAQAFLEQRRPSGGAGARLRRFALLVAGIGLPLLAIPSLRESLQEGLAFLAKRDEWAGFNAEQLPLFHGTERAPSAPRVLGLFAYLVPLLPVYLGWRVLRSREREKLLVLLFWVGTLSMLLLSQVRYLTDFTVSGSVAFAMILQDLRRGLARGIPASVATTAVATLAAICLLPVATGMHYASASRALAGRRPPDAAREAGRIDRESTARFGRRVREVTPEVSGFLDADERPEYGVLVPPRIGHAFTYMARRPVPSNNLGPYLDAEKYRLALAYYEAPRDEAWEIVEALAVRFVVTEARSRRPTSFADALHLRNESSVDGRPTSGRMRLVAMADLVETLIRLPDGSTRMRRRLPFKLFEIVDGAVLVADAAIGSEVSAQIELRAEQGFEMTYQTRASVGEDGLARLRVPYATGQRGAISTGVWRVRADGVERSYDVSEADVMQGREVRPRRVAPPADS